MCVYRGVATTMLTILMHRTVTEPEMSWHTRNAEGMAYLPSTTFILHNYTKHSAKD